MCVVNSPTVHTTKQQYFKTEKVKPQFPGSCLQISFVKPEPISLDSSCEIFVHDETQK